MTERINSLFKKGLFCCALFCTLVYASGIAFASSELFSIGIEIPDSVLLQAGKIIR